MRRLGCVLGLAASLQGHALSAQASSAGWQRVEQVPPGTTIRIKSDRRTFDCAFAVADDTALTCDRRSLLAGGRSISVARGDVVWIKQARQGLSRVTGTAIGAGAGIGIGAAIDASGSKEDGHLGAAVFGILGAIFGFAATSHVDFLAGPVLYKRN